MIRALLRFVLNQRLIVVALGIALIGAGLYAFGKLKIEAYPDISDTQAVVISLYPGHAAEEVEQQVTVPIERALKNVPRVIARRSRTIFGLSVVEMTFADPTDDYFARQLVMEKLRDAVLPAGVTPFGGLVKQFQIEVDPLELEKYSHSVKRIAEAISDNKQNADGAQLDNRQQSLVVR